MLLLEGSNFYYINYSLTLSFTSCQQDVILIGILYTKQGK